MALACISGGRECEGCMSCRPEPEVVYTCKNCGDDICEGEDFYRVGDTPYCNECVSPEIAELEV